MSKYGKCEHWHDDLEPVWFEEEEKDLYGIALITTGRKRLAVSHLVCPSCLRNYIVDDSFDEPWNS